MDTQEDGQRFCACIVECISDHESNVHHSDDHVKFRIFVNEDEYKEIITYNELMDFIEKNQENNAIVWRFQCIVGHQGLLLLHDKDYNGSRFNMLVKWENGEITTEPLLVIAADNPVTCAVYAREHDLLDVEGWKRFRNLAKHEKHFLHLIKQAKMKSYRHQDESTEGIQVLHRCRHLQSRQTTRWAQEDSCSSCV
jgi:hypothetical protein